MDMVGWTLNKSEVKAVYQSKKKCSDCFKKMEIFTVTFTKQ